jgi:tartrate dehydratase alpha subunit/fumarate hydratase class I-like protein
MDRSRIVSSVADAVVRASTVYTTSHFDRLKQYLAKEDNPNAS